MLLNGKYIISRSLHTAVIRFARKSIGRNPGIGHQLKQLGKTTTTSEELFEDFADMESDFMGIPQTHKEYEVELAKQSDKVRHLMVKHKYFREEKLPNLLTYAEKEQIRFLHAKDPEHWTVERLTISFPATFNVVQKILKAKWHPRSTKRIEDHDLAVLGNWKKLRNGELDAVLSEEFKTHLAKFATRKLEDLNSYKNSTVNDLQLPKPTTNEFSSIITSCKKKFAKNDAMENHENIQHESQKLAGGRNSTKIPNPEDETYLLEKLEDKRSMRLQELKELKLNDSTTVKTATAATSSLEDETNNAPPLLSEYQFKENNDDVTKSVTLNPFEKFESNEIVISVENQKRYEMNKIKDRIYIPKKLWKKGATYRIEDCFYADDGEFLYRVPGMTATHNKHT